MNLKKKCATLVTLFFGFFLVIGGSVNANAETEGGTEGLTPPTTVTSEPPVTTSGQVSVTVHNCQLDNDGTTEVDNTGEEITPPGKPLNGITFKAYDVTASFYDLGADDKALAKIQGSTDGTYTTKFIQSAITEKDGTANFHLNAKSQDKTNVKGEPADAVYLFVEEPKEGVSKYNQKSANMVIALPVYKLDGDEQPIGDPLTTIHVYPKNLVQTADLKLGVVTDISDELVSGAKFTLTKDGVGVYTGKTDESGFAEFSPVTDKSGNSNQVSDDKAIEGLLDGNYTLNEVSAPTDLRLTPESQDIKFTVKNGQIEESGKTDENGFVVDHEQKDGLPEDYNGIEYGKHKIEDDSIIVENEELGTVKFDKVDANTGDKLKDAEFCISKEIGKTTNRLYERTKSDADNPSIADYTYDYKWENELTDDEKNTEYTIVNVTDPDEIDYQYQVEKLRKGTYYLEEYTAPKDYVLPKGDEGITKIETDHEIKIPNVKRGSLPITGGIGTIIFIVAGVAIAGIALMIFKKTKERTEI